MPANGRWDLIRRLKVDISSNKWCDAYDSVTSHRSKGKAIPLQAWTDPEGSKWLRIPEFKTLGTRRWSGCQSYEPAAFNPGKYSWYSFLLEAESTTGP